MKVEPRVIRHKDAPTYLGVNVNYFNKHIRPELLEISFGPQMVGYDRVDLDQWFEDYKASNGRSGDTKEVNKPCRQKNKESQVLSCEGKHGGLIKKSLEKEFAKVVAQAITKKR